MQVSYAVLFLLASRTLLFLGCYTTTYVRGTSTHPTATSKTQISSGATSNEHVESPPLRRGSGSTDDGQNLQNTQDAAKSTKRTNEERPPNIIMLFMDDLGYGDVGFTGHPTTVTPNLDGLAKNGRILTTWYSGCSVCTASRAALMTGRQFLRAGLPGVLGPTENYGLPLDEITIAQHLKLNGGYNTAAVGKWHLGQRPMYLPLNRGFDSYLGIPYSDDMGNGRQTPCNRNANPNLEENSKSDTGNADKTSPSMGMKRDDKDHQDTMWSRHLYEKLGLVGNSSLVNGQVGYNFDRDAQAIDNDPAGDHLPLVYQTKYQGKDRTIILEQPLDFTTLALKYNHFISSFLDEQAEDKNTPFFLYVPFSHVHITRNTEGRQYSGCQFQNTTLRGKFGDALKEADDTVGNILHTLRLHHMEEDTIILFASDNGPWLSRGLTGGSTGLLTGRYSGYWDTGKGTTWEGGIRSPAFAYWKGTIEPGSRTSEVVSSLDIFPTLSSLAGIPLPQDVVLDGKDMTNILFNLDGGKSKHEFLFFYGTCDEHFPKRKNGRWGVAAVRHGPYKAHWCTGPGLSNEGAHRVYHQYPLMFDVEQDPSESIPLNANGTMPSDPEHEAAMKRILKAYAFEVATFTYGTNTPEPDGPGEGPGRYGLCCDRSKQCNCVDAKNSFGFESGNFGGLGLLNVGTKFHHDLYHEILGEEEPFPPKTRAQKSMLQEK